MAGNWRDARDTGCVCVCVCVCVVFGEMQGIQGVCVHVCGVWRDARDTGCV